METAYGNGDCVLYHDLYEKFSAENPSSKLREKAYYYDGMCYEKNGSADKAIGVYKTAMALYPENKAFAYRLAEIYVQAGFYEKSLPLFEAAISGHYYERDALLGAARASAALGRLEASAKYYLKALSLQKKNDPVSAEDSGIIKELVLCLIDSRRFEEARAYIEKGNSLSPSAAWNVLSANSYAAEGNFAMASEEMSNAIAEDDLRDYRIAKGFYDYWAGNIKQSEAAADNEIAKNPYDYLAVFLKGMALRSQGKKEMADSYFRVSACGAYFIGEMSRKMSSVPLPPQEELCK